MFVFAILIGVLSYLIFFIGVFGAQNIENVKLVFFLWLVFAIFFLKKKLTDLLFKCFKTFKQVSKRNSFQNSYYYVILLLFLLLGAVNFVGALGPELAFDALWYHLTLPKLYLEAKTISFIPGGLFYYSAMPKLGEMLYVASLAVQGETLAKGIHFFFGILTCIAIFQLSRKYLSTGLSLVVVVIFYSNLVVAWESITAYVDLIRTFYEVLAIFAFTLWYEKRKKTFLFLSALFLGFAITTKLLAVGSLFIFAGLLIYVLFTKKKKDVWSSITKIFSYWLVAFLVPLPWFVFSFIHTGNPFYPLFSSLYPLEAAHFLNPLAEFWTIFTHAADPISPIYLIFLPLLFFVRFSKSSKIILLYAFSSLLIWYITPRTGGGRFILPYLPAFSLLIGFVLSSIEKKKLLFRYSLVVIFFCSTITIGYRAAANAKYVPVILGLQTKDEFLSDNLNFSFGDFYDTDGFFTKTIHVTDRVLLYGFHNLYYVNFPFVDSTFVKKGEKFNYIAVQNETLPERFGKWKLIYDNKKTHVKVYSNNGKIWKF